MAFFFVEIRQEIALKAVKNDGLALPHCHRSLREDRDVVLCAVQSTWDVIHGFGLEQNPTDSIMFMLFIVVVVVVVAVAVVHFIPPRNSHHKHLPAMH